MFPGTEVYIVQLSSSISIMKANSKYKTLQYKNGVQMIYFFFTKKSLLRMVITTSKIKFYVWLCINKSWIRTTWLNNKKWKRLEDGVVLPSNQFILASANSYYNFHIPFMYHALYTIHCVFPKLNIHISFPFLLIALESRFCQSNDS